MAEVASKSTSKKKKNKKKKLQSDGFEVFLPLVKHGPVELPVLNTYSHCVIFTSRHRYNRWRDHYQMEISSVKRYVSVSRIPRMVAMMMRGRRPKGLCVDSNPVTSNQYELIFISRANDYKLTEDIERISKFIKDIIRETKELDPEPERA